MQWVLHDWNRGFEWHEPRGPRRRLGDEQVRRYHADGFVVLEDAFDIETVAEVVAAIDPIEVHTEAFLRTQPGGTLFIARANEISFNPHLVTRSPVLRDFCRHRVFQDVVHDLVGPDVRLYWDQAVYKKPGTTKPFPWHQDNGYTYVEPQQYLTCWVALTDADEDSGCPWVVPGVHRLGTLAHEMTDLGLVCTRETPESAQPVPVPAGGIAVFSSLTPHATGPNTSGAVRKTYIVQFAPDGAEVCTPGPNGTHQTTPANAPDRQFPVLVAGEPV